MTPSTRSWPATTIPRCWVDPYRRRVLHHLCGRHQLPQLTVDGSWRRCHLDFGSLEFPFTSRQPASTGSLPPAGTCHVHRARRLHQAHTVLQAALCSSFALTGISKTLRATKSATLVPWSNQQHGSQKQRIRCATLNKRS